MSRADVRADGGGRAVRVLYLVPMLGTGGVPQSLLLIARNAKACGVEFSLALLFPLSEPSITAELGALGVTPHVVGPGPGSAGGLRAWRRVVANVGRLCADLGIDVVDSCEPNADLAGRFACAGRRRKHVIHLIATGYKERLRRFGKRGWEVARLYAATSRLTDGYVAVSRTVAEDTARGLGTPRRRIAVISRGVDLEGFPAQPPRPADGRLRLLSVGRLTPWKGLGTAVRAVGLARSRGVDATLTIAGEGDHREALTNLVSELGLGGVVRFVGHTRAVADLHRDHDAFLFPSESEGLGNALLEAMASARPAIVSDIAPSREAAGPAALRFRPGDEAALAAAIGRVAAMSQAERAAMGSRARRRVEERYDIHVAVDRLAGYYRELIGGRR